MHAPQRQCVNCRQLYPRTQLHQLTRCRPSQAIYLNEHPRIMGRSAYVCRSLACVEKAIQQKRLSRALKSRIPDDIVNQLLALANEAPASGEH